MEDIGVDSVQLLTFFIIPKIVLAMLFEKKWKNTTLIFLREPKTQVLWFQAVSFVNLFETKRENLTTKIRTKLSEKQKKFFRDFNISPTPFKIPNTSRFIRIDGVEILFYLYKKGDFILEFQEWSKNLKSPQFMDQTKIRSRSVFPETSKSSSYVYLMKIKELPKYGKIGKSIEPERRAIELTQQHNYTFQLEHKFGCVNSGKVEKEILEFLKTKEVLISKLPNGDKVQEIFSRELVLEKKISLVSEIKRVIKATEDKENQQKYDITLQQLSHLLATSVEAEEKRRIREYIIRYVQSRTFVDMMEKSLDSYSRYKELGLENEAKQSLKGVFPIQSSFFLGSDSEITNFDSKSQNSQET